jgi:hypothetical protein
MNQFLNREPCLPSKIHGSEGQCPFHRGTLINNNPLSYNLSLFEARNTKLAYGFNEIVDDFFEKAPFILTD